MKTPSKAGWYVARGGFLEKGGKPFAGPFSSREDAMIAREALERELPNHSLWISEWTTPTVELPTEPTLGWLNDAPYLLAVWYPREVLGTAGVAQIEQTPFSADHIRAFTPAAAVPKAALDELCEEPIENRSAPELRRLIDRFLAAVDEANRA